MLTFALSLALLAAAPDTAATPPSAVSDAKPEKPKMVCRSDRASGSRLKNRICMTQEQWDSQKSNINDADRMRGRVSS